MVAKKKSCKNKVAQFNHNRVSLWLNMPGNRNLRGYNHLQASSCVVSITYLPTENIQNQNV